MGKKGKGTASQQRSNYETGNMKVNNKKRTSMRICWSCISCHGCRPCWTLWFCSHGTSYLVLHWLSFFLAWLWIVFVKSNLANRLVKQCEWIKIENSLINALMQLRLRLACFFFYNNCNFGCPANQTFIFIPCTVTRTSSVTITSAKQLIIPTGSLY